MSEVSREAKDRAVVLLAAHMLGDDAGVRQIDSAPGLIASVATALQELMDERDEYKGLYAQLQKNCSQTADSRAVQEKRAEKAEAVCEQKHAVHPSWVMEAEKQRVRAEKAEADLAVANSKLDALRRKLRVEVGTTPDEDEVKP